MGVNVGPRHKDAGLITQASLKESSALAQAIGLHKPDIGILGSIQAALIVGILELC